MSFFVQYCQQFFPIQKSPNHKFLNLSTPSLRKLDNGQEKKVGEKGGGEKENIDGNSGHYVIASGPPYENQLLMPFPLV